MLKYLLDTNIVIYVIKRRPRIALNRFNREHGHMAVSSITLTELIHGAEKSNVPSRNLAAIEDFCTDSSCLPSATRLHGTTVSYEPR